MHIGAFAGWFIGLSIGKFYFDHLISTSFGNVSDFFGSMALFYGFAMYGAIFGVVLGVIVISALIIKEHACSNEISKEQMSC
jgi:hypothetical protein